MLPKEKPEDGVELAPPKRPPPDAAGVEEEAGAEVPGVTLPKLNDMAAEMSVQLLNVRGEDEGRDGEVGGIAGSGAVWHLQDKLRLTYQQLRNAAMKSK